MPTTTTPSARALLDVLLSGSYSAVETPSVQVTPEETRIVSKAFQRVLERMKTDHVSDALLLEMDALGSLLGSLATYDFRPFAPSAVFAGLTKPSGIFEAGGYDSLANFGWQSDRAWAVPENLSGRRIVYNNLPAPWGDRGPLWGIRAYNVVGELEDLEMWRCGDWERGREGHAVYLNVAGDFTLQNFKAVQCGGQALQVAWRAGETKMLPAAWPSSQHTLTLQNCEAIDCGMINQGMSVRASWPFSFFGPGSNLALDNVKVRTNLDPFVGDRNEVFRSHGALLMRSRDDGTRIPRAIVLGLDTEITQSDRPEVKCWSVDIAEFHDPKLVRTDGMAEINVVDDCGEVWVFNPQAPLKFTVNAAATPWGTPKFTKQLAKGEDFTWRK